MATADLLRVQDVRDAYRLIGDCRDLGSDPLLWQVRMFEGLYRLIGCVGATGGEGLLDGPGRAIVPLSAFDVGFDAADHQTYLTYMRDRGPAIDPFIRALQQVPGPLVVRTRKQLVPDRAYCRSLAHDRYFRVGNVHHRLASIGETANGAAISLLHLHRPRGDRDFSSRERALLEFFHAEIVPLVGRALVSAAEPNPTSLGRRLRQTLACLVEGDSEKQVAARLGVSQATAHQYVTALYRRFGVHSRGQLLAHVVKRVGHKEWSQGLDIG
jgi:DNA-binding CsgD family transcriptional regulator